MKIKSKLQFPIAIAIMSFAIFSMIFQGCEKEELTPENDLPFLELSSSIKKINTEDYDIIKQAKERLEKYISTDQGRFILNIRTGNQVNISDELFEYFQSSINNANVKLKNENYKILGWKIVKQKKVSILRLKSGVVEEADGSWSVLYSGVDFTWYGMDINISHEDLSEFQAGLFGFSYILTKCKTGDPTVDAWIESAEAISFFSGLLSSVYDNGKGFTIVCPLYVPTYAKSY